MADDPIEQFLCRTLKRERPNRIAIPFIPAGLCVQQTSESEKIAESQAPSVLIPPPRPPVPPRRHTLAEICRYADEQCAYIEWMTRELEAEEAARRHSVPTTPVGAITNPFSGPADMWWRPTSANEMYGKSALRRQQEREQIVRTQHPYLAANGFPEVLKIDRPTENESKPDTRAQTTDERIDATLSSPEASEKHTARALESNTYSDKAEDHVTQSTESLDERVSRQRCESVPASTHSTHGSQTRDLPSLEQSSMLLMIPKVLLCFLLLPLILTVGWCSHSLSEDEDV